jgi:hypothetical protein
MTNRAIRGTGLSLAIALATLACSPSSSHPITERADGRAQEVREDADEIPCEPRLVLQTVCQRCHSLSPQNGAPFPLVRRSDILAMRGGSAVRELMIPQLESKRMPLTPVTIDPEAREVLLDWLRAGAPAVAPNKCDGPRDGGSDSEPTDSAPPDPIDACTGNCLDAHLDAGPSGDAESDAAPE